MFLLFEEYEIIFESNKELDLEFDKLDENIKGIIDNPVKYTKIKNNAKKLQQALIQKDTADLQYQKKIKGKEIPAEKKEIMKAATAAKKKALDDQISAINGRMDDLGSTEALQLVVRLAKSKAKINATEKILKTATEAESAQLKSKVDKLKQQVQKDEAKAKELGNKSKEKAKEEPKKEEPKEEPKKDDTSKEAQIEKDIKTINKNIQDARKNILKFEKELEEKEKEKKRSTDPDSYDDKILELKKRIEDENEDIKELKAEEAKLKKELRG